jgi:hypothetical protein
MPGSSCTITVGFMPSVAQIAFGALTVGAASARYATLLGAVATIEAQISSSTTSATVNVPFTLTWSATPGSTCTAQGDTQFYGPIAASGSKVITEPAAETATFALSCTQGSQSAQAHVTVVISAARPVPTGGSPGSGGSGGSGGQRRAAAAAT